MQHLRRAAEALRANRPEEALRALGDAGDGPATYLRAASLGQLGRTEEADAAFAEAARLGGAPAAELHENRGNMLRRAGLHERALAAYEAGAAAGGTRSLARHRALSLTALGRDSEARSILEDWLREQPHDPLALNTLGVLLNQAERPAEAARILDRCIALRPTPAALNNRATSARAMGAHAEALTCLRRARAMLPKHLATKDADIAANLAAAASRLGHQDEATHGFIEAVNAAPSRSDLHATLNRHLWEADRHDLFLCSYEQAVREAPAPLAGTLCAEAGTLALRAGLGDEARRWFERAVVLAPTNALALSGLARTTPPGPPRQAAWRAAFEARPDDGTVRLGYAWYLVEVRDLLTAEKILDWRPPPAHRQATLAYDSTVARLLGRDRYERYYDLNRLVAERPIEAPSRYAGLPSFLDAIGEALEAGFALPAAPVDQTLFGGQQSRGDLWETQAPALLELRAAILAQASRFWEEARGPSDGPLRADGDGPLRYAGSWSVRLRSGGGHHDHYHPEGVLSSVHYVTIPPELSAHGAGASRPGWLRLGRPDLPAGHDLPAERHVKPEPGLLVLFPSYMWHGVEAFEAATPRVTTPADFTTRRTGV